MHRQVDNQDLQTTSNLFLLTVLPGHLPTIPVLTVAPPHSSDLKGLSLKLSFYGVYNLCVGHHFHTHSKLPNIFL